MYCYFSCVRSTVICLRKEGSQETGVGRDFSKVLKSMSFKAEHSWKEERSLINPQVLIHFETWPILQSQSTENVHTVSLIKPVAAIRDTEQVPEAVGVGEQEMEPGQTSCHKHTHMLFFQIQTQAYLFLFQGCTHCTRDTFSVTNICPNMVKLPPYSYSCWLVSLLELCHHQCWQLPTATTQTS